MKKASGEEFIRRHQLHGRQHLLYFYDGSRIGNPSMPSLLGRPDSSIPEEPSTIWTRLKIGDKCSAEEPATYPTYKNLTPDQKCAYLRWLARTEFDDTVSPSYATLYYLGLERKLFGRNYEQAIEETLKLRSAFPENYLVQRCSRHILAAATLFHDDHDALADLVGRGLFDEARSEFRHAVIYNLIQTKPDVRLPMNWLVRCILKKEKIKPSSQSESYENTRFRIFVDTAHRLLAQRSFAERFWDADARVNQNLVVEWSFAGQRAYLPPLENLEYKPTFESPDFLKDFENAWKEAGPEAENALRLAAIESGERADELKEQELRHTGYWQSYKAFDVGLEIRHATLLAEQNHIGQAIKRLERLLDRRDLGESEESRVRRILARIKG